MEEFLAKLARVRQWLAAGNKEAAVFSRRENYRWLACGCDNTVDRDDAWSPADVVVTMDEVYLAAPRNEMARHLEEDGWGTRARPIVYSWWEDRFAFLRSVFPPERTVADSAGTGFAAAGRALAELRYELHEQEIGRYRLLGAQAVAVHEEVLGGLAAGVSEQEAAARLAGALAARGLRPVVVLVGADDRLKRYPHPVPTAALFQERLLVSTCVEKWGLVLSSTYLLVTAAGYRRWNEKHRRITGCLARMIAETRPGLGVGAFVELMKESLAGGETAPDWAAHHQGGATGYRTRDYLAWPGSTETIRAGQAFAWNPYCAGMKQEGTFVTANGEGGGPVLLNCPRTWPSLTVKVGKEYSFFDLLTV